MARLPLIVGFGGVNAAGRSSFHHGYRRMVIDALPAAKADRALKSLAALMGRPGAELDHGGRHYLLDHSLIRRIEPDWFDPARAPLNRKLPVEANGSAVSFITKTRNLPPELPPHWRVSEIDSRSVRVDISGDTELLLPDFDALDAKAGGILPTGFDPGSLYQSRNHPRGLQLAVFAASDALGSMGLDWQAICDRVAPDQIGCYAGSALAQCDENGNGGLLGARYRGKRVTSKHLPFGLLDMPADFINAYVLGNAGYTGGNSGACATFLFSLRQGVEDIRSGRARVVVVGSAEAPVLPDVMEGFIAMGALATDKELLALDADKGLTEPDYRRASRPFSTNCGFTIAEGAQYVVLMDDQLALELGANIYAAVPEVFINADGFKKSISSPGIGNYITMAKSCATVRAILGDEALQRRSYVHAHGTSTPQNRVTESHIFNEVARQFGIEQWPVAAIKAYIGHTMGVAPGDQLAASLGVWADGIIPGIRTIDHVAPDVHRSNLLIGSEHIEVDPQKIDVSLLNAKGFGGNNASAPLLAPNVALRMLQNRHGMKALADYRKRNESTQQRAADYDERACNGDWQIVYHFDHNVLGGDDLQLDAHALRVPGFGPAVDLDIESPFSDWAQ